MAAAPGLSAIAFSIVSAIYSVIDTKHESPLCYRFNWNP
jgi:hypothetical protein